MNPGTRVNRNLMHAPCPFLQGEILPFWQGGRGRVPAPSARALGLTRLALSYLQCQVIVAGIHSRGYCRWASSAGLLSLGYCRWVAFARLPSLVYCRWVIIAGIPSLGYRRWVTVAGAPFAGLPSRGYYLPGYFTGLLSLNMTRVDGLPS